MSLVLKAVANAKRRKLIGYPEDYNQYRQGGRFGDVPNVGNDAPKSGSSKPAEGQKDGMHSLDPLSYITQNRQMDNDVEMQKEDLLAKQMEISMQKEIQEKQASHEERMALISQGINPDTMQSFQEEQEARMAYMESLYGTDDYDENWGEPDKLTREDLLKQSGSPQFKIGDVGRGGAIGGHKFFKEYHIQKE